MGGTSQTSAPKVSANYLRLFFPTPQAPAPLDEAIVEEDDEAPTRLAELKTAGLPHAEDDEEEEELTTVQAAAQHAQAWLSPPRESVTPRAPAPLALAKRPRLPNAPVADAEPESPPLPSLPKRSAVLTSEPPVVEVKTEARTVEPTPAEEKPDGGTEELDLAMIQESVALATPPPPPAAKAQSKPPPPRAPKPRAKAKANGRAKAAASSPRRSSAGPQASLPQRVLVLVLALFLFAVYAAAAAVKWVGAAMSAPWARATERARRSTQRVSKKPR